MLRLKGMFAEFTKSAAFSRAQRFEAASCTETATIGRAASRKQTNAAAEINARSASPLRIENPALNPAANSAGASAFVTKLGRARAPSKAPCCCGPKSSAGTVPRAIVRIPSKLTLSAGSGTLQP